MLRGVFASTFTPKSVSPIASENKRRPDVSPNLRGGIGIYQTRAQKARNNSISNYPLPVSHIALSIFKNYFSDRTKASTEELA
jgi:hypothetical protein